MPTCLKRVLPGLRTFLVYMCCANVDVANLVGAGDKERKVESNFGNWLFAICAHALYSTIGNVRDPIWDACTWTKTLHKTFFWMEEVLDFPSPPPPPPSNVIEVRSESGAYVLATIERMFEDEQNAQADMILVQACSILDANGTFPGLQASCMGLKREAVAGQVLQGTDLIPYGSTVYLCSTKGLTASAFPSSMTGEINVTVMYGDAHFNMHSEDISDKPFILIVACDYFGMTPSDYVLADCGTKNGIKVYELKKRNMLDLTRNYGQGLGYSAASKEQEGPLERVERLRAQANTALVFIPARHLEVRVPFYGVCSYKTVFEEACRLNNLDPNEFDTTSNSYKLVMAGERLILYTKDYADKRKRDMEEEEAAAKQEYYERMAKRTKTATIEAEEEEELNHCFVKLPDGSIKRLTMGRTKYLLSSVKRVLCNRTNLNPDEHEFLTTFGDLHAKGGRTYVLIKVLNAAAVLPPHPLKEKEEQDE